jgi:hypothetical protein
MRQKRTMKRKLKHFDFLLPLGVDDDLRPISEMLDELRPIGDLLGDLKPIGEIIDDLGPISDISELGPFTDIADLGPFTDIADLLQTPAATGAPAPGRGGGRR